MLASSEFRKNCFHVNKKSCKLTNKKSCEWWCFVKKTELVWRELVEAAIVGGQRRWENIDDLAFRAGVVPTTTNYALQRLVEIGAVRRHHAGFTLVNPDKALTLLCAARSIANDIVWAGQMQESEFRFVLSSLDERAVLGGAEAATELLGGRNTVADISEHLVYLRDADSLQWIAKNVPGEEFGGTSADAASSVRVTFLMADPRAARWWGRNTPFAQTYADLFATPGWQASEFRLALGDRFLRVRDWDQE